MLIICLIFSFVFLLFYDSIFLRNFRRYTYYRKAKRDAALANKKLLVVGCPKSGGFSSKISYLLKLYGCGDILIDLNPISPCSNHISIDILSYLRQQDDSSYVIFISGVLEYVDDLVCLKNELYRVSGGLLYVVPIDIIYEKYFNINLGKYNNLIRKNYIIHFPPKHNNLSFKIK